MLGGAVVYRYSARPKTVYMNITNRCSNSCSFCVRNFCSGLSGYELRLLAEPTVDEMWSVFQDEVTSSDGEVVWCGFGEPTMRLNEVLVISRKIKEKYPQLRIRLDTDGLAQLRNKDIAVARQLKGAGIESVSISLNAESEEKYKELCRPSIPGSYQAVLDFARDCRRHLSEVRLTVVDVDDVDVAGCKRIAESLGCSFVIRG